MKRYFRSVFRQAESYTLDVGQCSWFDYMHYHPDRWGYGNLGWRMRARHLEALAKVFDRFARELSRFERPYQLWIYLDVHDASYDAVFIHSPNPNHGNFPMVLEHVEWGIDEVSTYFESLLRGHRLRAGRWGDSNSYYVYSPDVGVSLAKGTPLD